MSTAIFYTTSTGNAGEVARELSKQLRNIEVYELDKNSLEKINNYEKLIIGVSTWGDGDLNDDFEDIFDDFSKLDFSSKTIALFGLGDQEGYPDEFCSAMGIIYEVVKDANIIGKTSNDEYEFDSSKAFVDGKFVGLALDEDNQDHLTQDRIKNWVENIKEEIL